MTMRLTLESSVTREKDKKNPSKKNKKQFISFEIMFIATETGFLSRKKTLICINILEVFYVVL